MFELVDEHGIDCELVRNGTLHCAVGRSGSPRSRSALSNGPSAARPFAPFPPRRRRARIGADIYAGSLLDMRAGTIQPLAYARGLARAAIAAGAAIHTQNPVRSAERTGKAWTIATDGGTVTADWIAVATDAYGVGPWPQGRREQVRLPYFNFATRPLSADMQAAILPGREGCWDTRMIMSSFRFDRAGRLMFGSVGALRGTGLGVHRAWAQARAREDVPPHRRRSSSRPNGTG